MRSRTARERGLWRYPVVVTALAAALVGGGAAPVAAAGAPGDGARPAFPAVGAFAALRGRWAWPVAPPGVTAAYAAPPTPYAAGHRGIDLAAFPEMTVTAPADGVVRFAGVVVDRPVLTLDHGGDVLSSYEPLLSGLPAGTVVARGAVIGSVASGGHCDGGCLHVGVRVGGQYVSPMLFFDRVPPAVLLPLGHG